jgi:hypothetical protein
MQRERYISAHKMWIGDLQMLMNFYTVKNDST